MNDLPVLETPSPSVLRLSIANITQVAQLGLWGRGAITSSAWTQDGSVLAIGTALGVYLYDADSLDQLRFIRTSESVFRVAFSPDGEMLATAGTRVELWEADTGRLVSRLSGTFEGGVTTLEFSAGGSWLGAMGPNGQPGDPPTRLVVWRPSTGERLYVQDGLGCGHGSEFKFSPDGRTVAVQTCGFVSIIRSATGEIVKEFGTLFWTRHMQFTQDGQALFGTVTAEGLSTVRIQDEEVSLVLPISGPDEFLISPDERTLVIPQKWLESANEWASQVWDIPTGTLRFEGDLFGAISFSPDSSRISVVTPGVGVQFWDVELGAFTSAIQWTDTPTKVTFGLLEVQGRPTASVLAIGDETGGVEFIDPLTGQSLGNVHVPAAPVVAIAFHPSGRLIAVATMAADSPRIFIVELGQETILKEFRPEEPAYARSYIDALAFSADGLAIAARISRFGGIAAWEIESGQPVEQPGSLIWLSANDLGAAPNGHYIDFQYSEDHTEVLDSQTQILLLELDVDPEHIPCQFGLLYTTSSDLGNLAIGCDLATIAVWGLQTGALRHELSGHKGVSGDGFAGNVLDLGFSPDGPLLASSGWDDSIRFWSADSGRLLLTLLDHSSRVFDIAWSADGRFLVSASWDGTVRLWGIRP